MPLAMSVDVAHITLVHRNVFKRDVLKESRFGSNRKGARNEMSYYVSPETALEYTRVLTHKMDVTPRDITEACIKIYSQFRAENPASSQCIYFDVTEQALLEFVNNNPDRYSYFNGKFCNENHGLFTGFGLYSPELRHIIDPRFKKEVEE